MAKQFLHDVRSLVFQHVDTSTHFEDTPEGLPQRYPTYLYLPQSVDQLPCYVVQRPSLDEGPQAAIAHVEVEVYGLGRTIRDDDAQTELDWLADGLVLRLWNVDSSPHTLKLTSIRAETAFVSNVEVPAYIGTVEVSAFLCP